MAGFPFVSLSPARLLNLKNSFANNINFHPMMDITKCIVLSKLYINIFIPVD
jgi:hypothetical protein